MALLLACDDVRGQAGATCNPDGTCDSPNLICADGPEWLGLPVREPLCKIRSLPNEQQRDDEGG